MLRLKSLGQTLIEVDGARLTPAAETLFATALYLIMEAGKPVGRDELARLIWPDVSEVRAQHGLRQVLYKLKSIGAEIETNRTAVALRPRSFEADYTAFLTAQQPSALEALTDKGAGTFLPGYCPQFSNQFANWVERRRDLVHSVLTRALVAAIGVKKGRSDWRGAERLAHECLAVDPLNEEATLTIAEVAALGGSKTKALSILNAYLDELGTGHREIRLPALALRRRISEAYQEHVPLGREAPFVGRADEMAELSLALSSAQNGCGRAYMVWGEPGIGKTRLISEFTRIAAIAPIQVVRVLCEANEAGRPLAAFIDMVPKLLATPGALGCSPESMQALRRLTAHDPDASRFREGIEHGESRYDSTRAAILDLLDCVAVEVCCIVVFENIHWLDAQSRQLIDELLEWLRTRQILLILTSRDQSLHNELLSHIHVGPLPSDASRTVAVALVDPDIDPAGEFVGWCVRSSGGNPYYLLELLRHGIRELHGYRPPVSLTRLLQDRVEALTQTSRQLLEICCVLGKHSTLSRIESCFQARRSRMLRALSDLEVRGLVELDGEHVISRHDVLTTVVANAIAPSAKAMLHRFVAQQLEDEANLTQSVSLLWECAEHWSSAAETARAIQLLRRCGAHLMDVGMPMEAANVLGRAIALASTVAEQYEIGALRVRALMHGERESESLLELDRLLVLRQSIVPTPFKLDEVGWMHLNAHWNNGASEVDLLRGNVEALASGNGSVQDRIRAAAWLLGAADNICDSKLGHRIYGLALPSIDEKVLAPEIRLSFEIVYHCSFGDRSRAVQLAHELLAYARDFKHVPFAIRYMRYAAQTFRCHGEGKDAIATYLVAYEAARSLNAPLAMANCAAALANTYLHLGELDAAEHYTRLAISSHVPKTRTLLDTHLLSNQCELSIKRNDTTSARDYLERIGAITPINDSPRAKTRKLALQMAIHLTDGRDPPQRELLEFESCFAVTRESTLQDFPASILMRAFLRSGRSEDARSLAERYVGRDRRELCLISHDLAMTIREVRSNAT